MASESPSDSTPDEPAAPTPQADLGSGSLFDIETPAPAAEAPAEKQPEPAVAPESPSDSTPSEPEAEAAVER